MPASFIQYTWES